MSCNNNAQNYNSSADYEADQLQIYHSPPWAEYLGTRSQYDLDMYKSFAKINERNYQQPWSNFDNLLGGNNEQSDKELLHRKKRNKVYINQ